MTVVADGEPWSILTFKRGTSYWESVLSKVTPYGWPEQWIRWADRSRRRFRSASENWNKRLITDDILLNIKVASTRSWPGSEPASARTTPQRSHRVHRTSRADRQRFRPRRLPDAHPVSNSSTSGRGRLSVGDHWCIRLCLVEGANYRVASVSRVMTRLPRPL
jgi:hypothetical protein